MPWSVFSFVLPALGRFAALSGLRHLPEVAVSLLSGCDTGFDNSDNEGVVVGALHIFPKQTLLSFYLFNAVLFNEEGNDHDQIFITAY